MQPRWDLFSGESQFSQLGKLVAFLEPISTQCGEGVEVDSAPSPRSTRYSLVALAILMNGLWLTLVLMGRPEKLFLAALSSFPFLGSILVLVLAFRLGFRSTGEKMSSRQKPGALPVLVLQLGVTIALITVSAMLRREIPAVFLLASSFGVATLALSTFFLLGRSGE